MPTQAQNKTFTDIKAAKAKAKAEAAKKKEQLNALKKQPVTLGSKLIPGQSSPWAEPTGPLPPAIKKYLNSGDPVKDAKVKELAANMAAIKAELEAIKKKQKLLYKKHDNIIQQQVKLPVRIDEKTLRYFHLVEKECSQALAAMRASRSILCRGVDGTPGKVFIGKPFDDRKPLDSSADDQTLFDAWLEVTGFKAFRGNSIFTTANPDFASGFGKLHLVFPKNGFQFTWSPIHDDVIVDYIVDDYRNGDEDDNEDMEVELEDLVSNMDDAISSYVDWFDDKEDIQKVKAMTGSVAYKSFLSTYKQFQNKKSTLEVTIPVIQAYLNFEATVKKKLPDFSAYDRKQMMMFIKEFQGAKVAPKGPGAELAKIKETAMEMVKKEKFTSKDFPAALRSGNEIYVHGEYIAFEYTVYAKAAFNYFKIPMNRDYEEHLDDEYY